MSIGHTDKHNILREAFYDPKQGMVNRDKLFPKLRHLGVRLKDIRDFINRQQLGQLYHGPGPKQYYPITGPPGSYQADLVFYPKTKHVNRGYDTALTLIEITSRKGYCIPIKGKKGPQVIQAMETFLDKNSDEKIQNITTDKGSEFTSNAWKELMTKNTIHHFLADEGDHKKMGMIERFNRTIKLLISKYKTAFQTNKWIDVLPELLQNYNNSVHSSTGFAPSQVGTKEATLIRMRALQKTAQMDRHKNINVGDQVRIAQKKENIFAKEGIKWSPQVHTVTEDNIRTFKVADDRRRYPHHALLKVHTPPETNPKYVAKKVITVPRNEAMPEPQRAVTRSLAKQR
jgi:transposase InsO family protein